MKPGLYGVMAEFASPETLLAATREAHAQGYRALEAYSPFSIEGLAEAAGAGGNPLPLYTLLGGIAGGAGAYALQWYSAVIDYPIDAGGRPLHAWPAFIPAVFEMTILGAALMAFFGYLLLNGLPALYHPVFNAPDFDLATRDRFFLCILCRGPHFDAQAAQAWLTAQRPIRVFDVAR